MPWLHLVSADTPPHERMINIDHVEMAELEAQADGRLRLTLVLPTPTTPLTLYDSAAGRAWHAMQQLGGVTRIELPALAARVERSVGAPDRE
jgi:hypothetical protein